VESIAAEINYIELIAVILSLLYVIYAAKLNIISWLFAFTSSLIYAYIFISNKLYFDSILNLYYVIMAVYGFLNWKNVNPKNPDFVTKIKPSTLIMNIIWGLYFTAFLGQFARKYTNADFAFTDAFTTVFAFIATYYLARKKLESWIFFIIVDTISVAIYFHKDLFLTAGLFVFYTVYAFIGYKNWKQNVFC
jgi:nicotinamide mononucleotide transporter